MDSPVRVLLGFFFSQAEMIVQHTFLMTLKTRIAETLSYYLFPLIHIDSRVYIANIWIQYTHLNILICGFAM